jgi:hypothetical protein
MAKPGKRVSVYTEFDEYADAVILRIGEAEVTRWPVPHGQSDDMKIDWKREQFVAARLGAMIDAFENSEEDR